MIDTLIALIAFSIIASMIMVVIIESYIAHRHIERYEGLLSNCIFINENKKLIERAGLPGKLLRILLIACVLAIPRIFTRKNLIDVNEVAMFPSRAKQLLASLLYIHCGTLMALVIFNYACLDP